LYTFNSSLPPSRANFKQLINSTLSTNYLSLARALSWFVRSSAQLSAQVLLHLTCTCRLCVCFSTSHSRAAMTHTSCPARPGPSACNDIVTLLIHGPSSDQRLYAPPRLARQADRNIELRLVQAPTLRRDMFSSQRTKQHTPITKALCTLLVVVWALNMDSLSS
jgi:hypothetical protein